MTTSFLAGLLIGIVIGTVLGAALLYVAMVTGDK